MIYLPDVIKKTFSQIPVSQIFEGMVNSTHFSNRYIKLIISHILLRGMEVTNLLDVVCLCSYVLMCLYVHRCLLSYRYILTCM